MRWVHGSCGVPGSAPASQCRISGHHDDCSPPAAAAASLSLSGPGSDPSLSFRKFRRVTQARARAGRFKFKLLTSWVLKLPSWSATNPEELLCLRRGAGTLSQVNDRPKLQRANGKLGAAAVETETGR